MKQYLHIYPFPSSKEIEIKGKQSVELNDLH